MSYRGQWCIVPVGQMGLQTDQGSSELPIQSLIRCENCSFVNGSLEKAPGAQAYNLNGAFTAGIVSMIDYWPTIIQQRLLVATADGKIWKDYGDRSFNAMVPIATNVNNGALNTSCQFVIGGNEVGGNPKTVFLFTGTSQIQVFSGDGNQIEPISLPSADWPNATASSNPQSVYPRFGLIHRARLWCFRNSIAYASNTSNHQDFQTLNSILVNNVGPGEGGDIIGAFVYKRLLFVFKQGGYVYNLVDTDSNSANWYFTKFAEGLCMANLHSATQVIDDLLVGNDTGVITSYTATLNYGDVKQGDVFKMNKVSQYYRQYTDVSGIQYMQGIFYSEKGLALFPTRSTHTTYNDVMVQYDVSNPAAPKFGLWNHYQADCIALRRDVQNIMRPIYGGTDGNVYMADWPTYAIVTSSTTTGYTANFKTPYYDMRHLDPTMANKNKIFERLACVFTPTGNTLLNVDVWIDGRFSETVTLTQTVDNNYLGSFQLDTPACTLGSEDEQTVYATIHGKGKRISLRGYNGNAYETFRISSLNIGFRVAGEDATVLAGQGG